MRWRMTSGEPGEEAGGADAATLAPEEEPLLAPEEDQVPAAKRHFMCAECAHAQLFATRPLAVCTYAWGGSRGRVLYAGRPACERVLPRNGPQGAASWYKRGEQS